MLRKAGYAGEIDLDYVVVRVGFPFRSGAVPHEIGIVLGYPLKDVAGFMGISRREFSCQGPWKIYGNPERKPDPGGDTSSIPLQDGGTV